MKDKLLVLTAFAIMLVACSKDSESMNDPAPISKDNTSVNTQQPVQFGAYVNRAVTRAGDPGTLVTSGATEGQVSLEQKGFGVFAYYTDDDLYSPIYQPNFMYNTKVSTANWTYNPVRYWPNEFGSNAASEGIDRLSFFAYAPWVEVTPSTGIVTGDNTYGIVGMSRNAATGNPLVKYYASLDPSKQVDFCWGVDKTTGKPILDLTKQGVSEKVEFAFNHALAALNVQIDAAIDQLNPGGTLDANTKIYVRSVTFEGFVTKGSFNLNTDKATWYDLAGANYIDGGFVTIFDGRTNGKEGQSESANESPVGLNPVVVQSQPYSGTPTAGVTPTAVNLFDNATATAPLYVIPSGQPLNVTIVYDVETQNDKLVTYLSDGVTHGTSVENKITKAISFGASNKLEAGKKYNLTLHLGMTSVKFDAVVSNWDDNTDNGEAGLPDNIGTAPGPGPTPTTGYYRGYDISKGILVRNGVGSYSLTDGSNPFELYGYYENSGSLDKYYIQWSTLLAELGADGDNIDADSDVLPIYSGTDRWTMPSDEVWETILTGSPLQEITVGNTVISTSDENKAWALVTVSDGTNSYYGTMILRDGSTIPAGLLDESSLGDDYGDFSDNELSMDVFNSLIAAGCVFISCGGQYSGVNSDWYGLNDSYWDDEGFYWSSSSYDDPETAYLMDITVDYGASSGSHTNVSDYYPVRLVKKMN